MRKYLDKYQRKRRRRKIQLLTRMAATCIILLVLVGMGMYYLEIGPFSNNYVEQDLEKMELEQPQLDVQLLTINPYSRPGTQSEKIRNIVIHYTANPGTTAIQNRNYFEGLKDTGITKASSHFIVGLDGEIIQCVPTWEIAYASNDRNIDTVSIETCHQDESGNYTDETYDALVELTTWLCEKFGLTEQDVIRHYDITGKICPKYFVENEDAWEIFKNDVKHILEAK